MATMTSAITQVYRTICIPNENRIDIPSDYVGRELEIIVIPLAEIQSEYNEETLAAMQEAEDIASGKIQTKSYSSHKELVAEIEAEIAAEDNN
jgi:predicted RecB family endonuclease